MQVRDAADVRPVLVDLRVDAPLDGDVERLVATRVVVDLPFHVVDEDLVGAHRGLFVARAGRDVDDIGPGDADRDVAEKADVPLHAEDAAHDRELAAPGEVVRLADAGLLQQRDLAHAAAVAMASTPMPR